MKMKDIRKMQVLNKIVGVSAFKNRAAVRKSAFSLWSQKTKLLTTKVKSIKPLVKTYKRRLIV